MTVTGYLLIGLFSFVSGFVMYILGMRHGSKTVAKELDLIFRENMKAKPRPKGYIDYSQPAKYKPKRLEEYVIGDRVRAEDILTILATSADKYGFISVADYYDLIKVDTSFSDNNWGWKHETISKARVIPVRGGYSIKFPPMQVL